MNHYFDGETLLSTLGIIGFSSPVLPVHDCFLLCDTFQVAHSSATPPSIPFSTCIVGPRTCVAPIPLFDFALFGVSTLSRPLYLITMVGFGLRAGRAANRAISSSFFKGLETCLHRFATGNDNFRAESRRDNQRPKEIGYRYGQ